MPNVYVDFVARGIPNIAAAVRSVEQIVTGVERRAQAAASAPTSASARVQKLNLDQLNRGLEQWRKRNKTAADEQIRDVTHVAKLRERLNKEEQRATERRERAAKRETDVRIREQKREADAKVREQKRAAAEIEHDQNRRARAWLAKAERRQERAHHAYADAIVGGAGQGARSFMSTGWRAASQIAGTLTELGGGFSVAGALGSALEEERAATRLAIQSRVKGVTPVASTEVLRAARELSPQTGTDTLELIKAGAAYSAKSPDFENLTKNMELFAKVAKVSGANLTEVANTAGVLRMQNKNIDADTMKKMMLNIMAQSRLGGIDFPEMANIGGSLTGQAPAYAGNLADTQRILLGMIQTVAKASGRNPSQAATNIRAFTADVITHEDRIRGILGRNFLNKSGEIDVSAPELVAQIMEKTQGNLAKIQQEGKFGAWSRRVFQSVSEAYKEGVRAADMQAAQSGRTLTDQERAKAGGAAVLEEFRSKIAPTQSEEQLDKDLSDMLSTPAEKFEAAVRQLRVVVSQELLPFFTNELLPAFRESLPDIRNLLQVLASMGRFITKHYILSLFAGLAASISMAVAQNVAAAGIGNVIVRILERRAAGSLAGGLAAEGLGALAARGGGKAAAAAAGGSAIKKFLPALAAAGPAAALAATVAYAAYERSEIIDAQNKKRKDASQSVMDAMRAENIATRIHHGVATKADLAEAPKLVGALAQDIESEKAKAEEDDKWRWLTKQVAPQVAADEERMIRERNATLVGALERLRAAIENKGVPGSGGSSSPLFPPMKPIIGVPPPTLRPPSPTSIPHNMLDD